MKNVSLSQKKVFATCCTSTHLTNPQDCRFRQRKQRGNKNEIREKSKEELPLSQAFVIKITQLKKLGTEKRKVFHTINAYIQIL
jgi:hypothetical protein